MGSIFVVCIYFFVSGRASHIGVLAIGLQLMIGPTLVIGGTRLIALLKSVNKSSKNNTEEELDLPKMITQTTVCFVVAVPSYILFALLYTNTVAKIYNKGERNLIMQVTCISLFGLSMTLASHMVLTFFEATNADKKRKLERKKGTTGGRMFSSLFKSSKKKSKGTAVNPAGISTKKSDGSSLNSSGTSSANTGGVSANSSNASSAVSDVSDVSGVSEVSEVSGFSGVSEMESTAMESTASVVEA